MRASRSRPSSRRSPSSSAATPTGRSSSTGTNTLSARAPDVPGRRSPTEGPPFGAPLFVLNLKAYPGSVGADAVRIGAALERLARAAGVAAAIAPAAPDLARLASALRIPVLSQHVDAFPAGPYTGWVVPSAVRASGGRGSLVNHSEHPLEADLIPRALDALRSEGLVPIVCAKDVDESARLAAWAPDYLAVEPPELIGGDRAVSTARPEVVSGTVEAVRRVAPSTHVLCGAGVHDRTDVRRALELGSAGVLVASAVTRASSPSDAMAELLAGFRGA